MSQINLSQYNTHTVIKAKKETQKSLSTHSRYSSATREATQEHRVILEQYELLDILYFLSQYILV